MASSVNTAPLTGYLITSGVCPFIDIQEKQLRVFANGDVSGLEPYVAIGEPQKVQVPREQVDNIISYLKEMGEIGGRQQEIAALARSIFKPSPSASPSGIEYVDAIRLKPEASTPEEALLDLTEIYIPSIYMRVLSDGSILRARVHSRPRPNLKGPAQYSPFLRAFWSLIPFLGHRPELRMIRESLLDNDLEKIKVPFHQAQQIRRGCKDLNTLAIRQMILFSKISEAVSALFPQ